MSFGYLRQSFFAERKFAPSDFLLPRVSDRHCGSAALFGFQSALFAFFPLFKPAQVSFDPRVFAAHLANSNRVNCARLEIMKKAVRKYSARRRAIRLLL
jgi:hypothetical protein